MIEKNICEKIKIINNKIEQSKTQYNLDRQTTKISEIWIFDWNKCFTRKRIAKKAAALKRFEYSLLVKELKKQNSVAEKQYQKFDNTYMSEK